MTDRWPDTDAQVIPAGFGRRLAAWIIDVIIVVAGFFVVGIYLWPDLVETTTLLSEVDGARLESVNHSPTVLGSALLGIALWAYTALQESGRAQATLGKRALGLRVTDLDGARVSLLRASCRSWPLWLPGVLAAVGILEAIAGIAALVACLAVLFTRRKQGLHDMMARCLVVRRPPAVP